MNEKALISFVIPVLNEQESLEELWQGICANVPEEYAYEIWFVDDGSTDASADVIRRLRERDENVHLISFRRNFGKAMALQTGFRNARGEIILTMDADLQDDPVEIPRFLDKIHEGYDLVSGWKKDRKDPLEKRLPSRLFNHVVTRMSGVKLHDFNCGFKAYRRETVEAISVYGEMHRYIPCLAARKGFRIAEIPVLHHARKHGHSKYGLERYVRGFLDSLTILFLMRFYEQPMYLFGRGGAICGGSGFLICLYLVILKLRGEAIGGRPLLMLGILLVVTGLQLFSIGLIGNLIVDTTYRRNYDESHVREKL